MMMKLGRRNTRSKTDQEEGSTKSGFEESRAEEDAGVRTEKYQGLITFHGLIHKQRDIDIEYVSMKP